MTTEVMGRMEQLESGMDKTGMDKETLFMLGGIAMLVFGAGLILANPAVRRYLGNAGVGNFISGTFPDLERYFRLRSM